VTRAARPTSWHASSPGSSASSSASRHRREQAGSGGTIGTAAVARARPDGYTLLVQSASYTVTPTTYPNTPYDTQRDLMGVTPLGLLPQALVVAPSRGINSVQALVATAKAKPGTLNYGSAGVGTANQLNAERFRIGAGIDAVHVPFKGTPRR